tara:strand:+ start:764 stop:1429 length:666 start_codon:yes stop_codon:yes gene_type:complete
MATRALIGFLDDDKQFTSTYNHYDGYPEHTGKLLKKYFNDVEAAERVAATGYISSIDDEGNIDSKYDEEPYYKVIDAEDAFTAGMMIGDEVKDMTADYGYIWVRELGKWITVKNQGGDSIAKQLEDELGESGMYMVDENINEAGYEAKWAQFLNEAEDVDFGVIKSFIAKDKDIEMDDFALDAYMESIKNSFRLNKDDYKDYEMDDFVEDFDNYVSDKMDS